jgi:hypothetical protein
MSEEFTDADLEGYLDEALPPEAMARIESVARADQALLSRLSGINARRDAGSHSLGEIWRRNRLSCPSRADLGSCLLGVADEALEEYTRFHLSVIGCRYCQANWDDLAKAQREAGEVSASRRKKYFQSSAGYLKKK